MILGLLGILIGLYAIRHIIVSVVALALLIGIYWVAYGTASPVRTASSRALARLVPDLAELAMASSHVVTTNVPTTTAAASVG